LRAKFRSDSNFSVHEIGRGRGVEERSLEITEVLWTGGSRWWRREAGLQIFWKRIAKVYLVCRLMSLSCGRCSRENCSSQVRCEQWSLRWTDRFEVRVAG